MWTRFMDMHSGGGTKEAPYEYIYIEAPIEEAKVIFYNRFGHNPERVTCTCCGDDYSIDDAKTLEEACAFERGCQWDETLQKYIEEPKKRKNWSANYISIEEYRSQANVLIIPESEIKPSERTGDVPEQGYQWVG